MATRKSKKNQASLGCIFWIGFILLLIILFFFYRKNISSTLEKTGFLDKFFPGNQTVELTDPATVAPPAITIQDTEPAATPAAQTAEQNTTSTPAANTVPITTTAPAPTVNPAATTSTQNSATSATQTAPASATVTAKPPATRRATLWFVSIDSDGRVLRKETVREMAVTDSPLTESLKTLFAGTTSAESAKGLRSLIPPATRLLGVSVRDGVATVNVSEDFQFNQYGIEGYLGQLSQIVFTATSFSTVSSVQFLIEGQRREYLGAEGIWIGTPLSRDKF